MNGAVFAERAYRFLPAASLSPVDWRSAVDLVRAASEAAALVPRIAARLQAAGRPEAEIATAVADAAADVRAACATWQGASARVAQRAVVGTIGEALGLIPGLPPTVVAAAQRALGALA